MSLKRVETGNNQFVLDIGSMERNRFSLYLDSQHNLCFKVVDEGANAMMVKVEPGLNTFLFDNVIYVFCEYGSAEDFSFVRLVINGKDVAEKHQNGPIKLPGQFLGDTMVIGQDLDAKNGGAFVMAAVVFFKTTMHSTAGISKAMDILNESVHRSDRSSVTK
jgi:hypothetical protein